MEKWKRVSMTDPEGLILQTCVAVYPNKKSHARTMTYVTFIKLFITYLVSILSLRSHSIGLALQFIQRAQISLG
jgi:hypothetical protein